MFEVGRAVRCPRGVANRKRCARSGAPYQFVALLRADSFPASRFVRHVHGIKLFSLVHFLELSLIPAFFLVRLWVAATRRSSNAIFYLHDGW